MSKTKKILVVSISAVLVAVISIAVVLVVNLPKVEPTATSHISLAENYLLELNYEAAIAEYRAAIEIDPKNTDYYIALAEIYIQIGNTEAAIDVLEEGLAAVDESDKVKIRDLMENVVPSQLHEYEDTVSSITVTETTILTTETVETTVSLEDTNYIDDDGYLFQEQPAPMFFSLVYPEDDKFAEEFNKLVYETMNPIYSEIKDVWNDDTLNLDDNNFYNPFVIENERYIQIIYSYNKGFKDNWNAGNIITFCYDKVERKIITLEDAISNDENLPSGTTLSTLTDKAMTLKRHQLDGYTYDSGELLSFIYSPDGNGGYMTQYFMKTRFPTDLSRKLSEYLYAYTPKMERIDLVYYDSPVNNLYRPEKIRNEKGTGYIEYAEFTTYNPGDPYSLILNATGGEDFSGIQEGSIVINYNNPDPVNITKNGVETIYEKEPIVIGSLSYYSYSLFDDSGKKQYEIYFNETYWFSVRRISLYDAKGNPIGEWNNDWSN
jgi:tetratricopeptide (TPR) repeat protein